MSLRSLFNTRESVRFGGDVAVPKNDININGDLNINGTIDGSSTPANQNNTWSGTNEFSILPTSSFLGNAGKEVPNKEGYGVYLDAFNATKQANTWSGVNAFNNNIGCTAVPSANTQAVNGAYITSTISGTGVDYITSNNTWSGANTWNITPTYTGGSVNATDAVSKSYVDTTILGGAFSTTTTAIGTGATTITQADVPANTKVYSLMLCGGGGGSTSAVGAGSSPGVSGAQASNGTFHYLVDSSVTDFNINWTTGGGGSQGYGCGTTSASGTGGSSQVNSFIGSGSTPDCVGYTSVGWTFGGGGGFGGSCGDKGTSNGGSINLTPSGNNANVISLATGWKGKNGTWGGGYTSSGTALKDAVSGVQYGTGGYSSGLSQGQPGYVGGYATTSYVS